MSSSSLRNAVAAVVFATLLGLAASPAAAQPRDTQEPSRVEMDFATRVWLWLTRISTPPEARHSQTKSLSGGLAATDQSLTPSVLGRAGAFDPNG